MRVLIGKTSTGKRSTEVPQMRAKAKGVSSPSETTHPLLILSINDDYSHSIVAGGFDEIS